MGDNETTLAISIQSGTIQAIECGDHALTVPEVAQVFGVTSGTVYRLVRQRILPAFYVGGSIRFYPKKLVEYTRGVVVSA